MHARTVMRGGALAAAVAATLVASAASGETGGAEIPRAPSLVREVAPAMLTGDIEVSLTFGFDDGSAAWAALGALNNPKNYAVSVARTGRRERLAEVGRRCSAVQTVADDATGALKPWRSCDGGSVRGVLHARLAAVRGTLAKIDGATAVGEGALQEAVDALKTARGADRNGGLSQALDGLRAPAESLQRSVASLAELPAEARAAYEAADVALREANALRRDSEAVLDAVTLVIDLHARATYVKKRRDEATAEAEKKAQGEALDRTQKALGKALADLILRTDAAIETNLRLSPLLETAIARCTTLYECATEAARVAAERDSGPDRLAVTGVTTEGLATSNAVLVHLVCDLPPGSAWDRGEVDYGTWAVELLGPATELAGRCDRIEVAYSTHVAARSAASEARGGATTQAAVSVASAVAAARSIPSSQPQGAVRQATAATAATAADPSSDRGSDSAMVAGLLGDAPAQVQAAMDEGGVEGQASSPGGQQPTRAVLATTADVHLLSDPRTPPVLSSKGPYLVCFTVEVGCDMTVPTVAALRSHLGRPSTYRAWTDQRAAALTASGTGAAAPPWTLSTRAGLRPEIIEDSGVGAGSPRWTVVLPIEFATPVRAERERTEPDTTTITVDLDRKGRSAEEAGDRGASTAPSSEQGAVVPSGARQVGQTRAPAGPVAATPASSESPSARQAGSVASEPVPESEFRLADGGVEVLLTDCLVGGRPAAGVPIAEASPGYAVVRFGTGPSDDAAASERERWEGEYALRGARLAALDMVKPNARTLLPVCPEAPFVVTRDPTISTPGAPRGAVAVTLVIIKPDRVDDSAFSGYLSDPRTYVPPPGQRWQILCAPKLCEPDANAAKDELEAATKALKELEDKGAATDTAGAGTQSATRSDADLKRARDRVAAAEASVRNTPHAAEGADALWTVTLTLRGDPVGMEIYMRQPQDAGLALCSMWSDAEGEQHPVSPGLKPTGTADDAVKIRVTGDFTDRHPELAFATNDRRVTPKNDYGLSWEGVVPGRSSDLPLDALIFGTSQDAVSKYYFRVNLEQVTSDWLGTLLDVGAADDEGDASESETSVAMPKGDIRAEWHQVRWSGGEWLGYGLGLRSDTHFRDVTFVPYVQRTFWHSKDLRFRAGLRAEAQVRFGGSLPSTRECVWYGDRFRPYVGPFVEWQPKLGSINEPLSKWGLYLRGDMPVDYYGWAGARHVASHPHFEAELTRDRTKDAARNVWFLRYEWGKTPPSWQVDEPWRWADVPNGRLTVGYRRSF